MLPGWIIQKLMSLQHKSRRPVVSAITQQALVLRQLIRQASVTEFGKQYLFKSLLLLPDKSLAKEFGEQVPLHSYEEMYTNWWNKILEGENDICWPGATRFFSMTSGTTLAGTKYIPLTAAAIKSIRKAGLEMAGNLSLLTDAQDIFSRKTISIGGSTTLEKQGGAYAGDFSGILMKQSPAWYKQYILPANDVHALKSWEQKLAAIVTSAPDWNPGSISGFPVRVLPMLQAIMERYKLNSIHDLWPDLQVMLHGGMSMEPYRQPLMACFSKPVTFMETYVASEGYIANQTNPLQRGMQMVCNGGLYFEFVEHTNRHFSEKGQLLPDTQALGLHEVETGKPYALILSGNNGCWRYVLGDVIQFVETNSPIIKWVGRTAHFLNVAGEHLSLGNLEQAFAQATRKLNMQATNFIVRPDTTSLPPTHHWIIDQAEEVSGFNKLIDHYLGLGNYDYKKYRMQQLLGEPVVHFVPRDAYFRWMELLGKTDGQHKYLRVINGGKIPDFIEPFL